MTQVEVLDVTEVVNIVELGVTIIGFRNEDLSKHFMIQQSLDELEKEPGSYHIELNEQNFGGYGLIEKNYFWIK